MDRIVIVTKPTRLEELVQIHLTEGAAEFILESRGQSITPYRSEDATYRSALATVRQQLPNDIAVTFVARGDLPNFLFRDNDLVIVCGPDGLFANVAKYLGKQLVLTVNPDPSTVAGILMLFPPKAVGSTIAKVRAGTHQSEKLPFVKASINDGEKILWGINDLFIGRNDHVSARYSITLGIQSENQSSSGIIVSTGIGATGWMRSVAAMVAGLVPSGTAHKLTNLPATIQNELVFVVREPFPSPTTKTNLVTGRIVPGKPLVVNSAMASGGYIFSDGVTEKAIEWNAGSKITVTVGERHIERIVP